MQSLHPDRAYADGDVRSERNLTRRRKMGLTIRSKNHSIDIGSGGFFRLRMKIAGLTNKEISDHYKVLASEEYIHMVYHGFEEYDKKTEELYERYRKEYGKVIDFLYAPDTKAKMTYGCAKQILKAIGDRTDMNDIQVPGVAFQRTARRIMDGNLYIKNP